MNKQERLMVYLYGEMSAEERKAFEVELKADPELLEELEGFKDTRFRLNDLPDIKPEATVLNLTSERKINWRKWGIRLGVAASFVLLLGLTNARIEFSQKSLTIAFGKEAPTAMRHSSEMASSNQGEYLKEMLFQKELEFNQKLIALDSIWQRQLEQNNLQQQEALVRQWKTFQNKREADFAALKTQFRDKELPQFAAIIQEMQVEQKQELQLLLSEFWENWQQTRFDDLKAIETEFVSIYQNVERNQTETAAVIDNIIRGNF